MKLETVLFGILIILVAGILYRGTIQYLPNRQIYEVTYLDGSKDTMDVDHPIYLRNGCILFQRNGRTLVCGVRSFKQK